MSQKKSVRFLAILFAFACNALVGFLSFFFPFIARWNRPLKAFLTNREWDQKKREQIQRERATKEHCVVFFCSSAGEYEQARPLASRLLENPGTYVHFLFFSQSGYSFAALRKETIPYSLSPLDSFRNWRHVLDLLRPDVLVIVRHELWPACLWVATQRCNVFLINASLTTKGSIRIFMKSLLLSFVHRIYTVSEEERGIFMQQFSSSETCVLAVGDSKYDRVLERVAELRSKSDLFPMLSRSLPRLVVGSAWKRDCDLAIAAFARFRSERPNSAQMVIAPHQPTVEFIEWLEMETKKAHLTCVRLSQLKTDTEQFDVVIVDSVGVLFDLYAVCNVAFVGGALHHKVHNVLEPAAHGLPIAFGPLFKNSHEACDVVENHLATVVQTEADFYDWMGPLLVNPRLDLALQKFLMTKAGATERMTVQIASVFRPALCSTQVAAEHL